MKLNILYLLHILFLLLVCEHENYKKTQKLLNGFSKNIGWKISPGDRTGNCFLTLFEGAICENLGNCGKNVQT